MVGYLRDNTWMKVTGAMLVIVVGVGIWPAAADPGDTSPVMGPLEEGVNRQGMDFSAYGAHADNPQLCAEMCRTNDACKAMTYVISQKTCWLKKVVPPRGSPHGPDYVSSVKVYPSKQ